MSRTDVHGKCSKCNKETRAWELRNRDGLCANCAIQECNHNVAHKYTPQGREYCKKCSGIL